MSKIPTFADTGSSLPQKRVLSDIQNYLPKRRRQQNSMSRIDDYLGLKLKLQPSQPLLFDNPNPPSNTPQTPANLTKQVQLMKEKIEDLEEEIKSIVQQQHKHRSRIADLQRAGASSQRRLERENDHFERETRHSEKMLGFQLCELQVKLQDDLNELRFNLASEVADVKTFRNDDCREETRVLKQRAVKLAEDSQNVREHNRNQVKNTTDSLAEELDKYMVHTQEEIDQLAEKFEHKDERVRQLDDQISQLKEEVTSAENANTRSEEAIQTFEKNMNNFPALKATYLHELAEIEAQVHDSKLKYAEVHTGFTDAQREHATVLDKLNAQTRTRRVLENSIMDYEGKVRVYAYIHEGLTMSSINKALPVYEPSLVADEASCLINSALRGHTISVVFAGRKVRGFVGECVAAIYENLQREREKGIRKEDEKRNDKTRSESLGSDLMGTRPFTLQQICIRGDRVVDVLNLGTQLHECIPEEFASQPMILDGMAELRAVLREGDGVQVYRISVPGVRQGRAIESEVRILDLTGQSAEQQTSQLTFDMEDSVGRFLRYSYTNSKCLVVGNVDNKSVLEALEKISKMERKGKEE